MVCRGLTCEACVRLSLHQGVWFPREGGNDTIEKIADTRSDVAVQLLLFNQTMTSFKTAITLLRDMQQLIGKRKPSTRLAHGEHTRNASALGLWL